jgi:hypothetical protein
MTQEEFSRALVEAMLAPYHRAVPASEEFGGNVYCVFFEAQ